MKHQNGLRPRSPMRPIVVYRPSWRRYFLRFVPNTKDALRAKFSLMSFKGIGKSFQTIRDADRWPASPAHRLDEFPVGYSLTVCSPALPVSASPTAADYPSQLGQIRGGLF